MPDAPTAPPPGSRAVVRRRRPRAARVALGLLACGAASLGPGGVGPGPVRVPVREARAADAPAAAPPSGPATPDPVRPAPASRPFRMGFTPWPSDLTAEGVRRAADFLRAHGDLVSVMVIGGLPWPEALAGTPFPADVTRRLTEHASGPAAVFLSISPLDAERRALAPLWAASENQPLPAPWAGRAFDHPDVVKAFVAFCLRAVRLARPAVLAIGVEDNVLLTHDPKAWPALKRLHRAAHAAVKRAHPALPVCFTTEVNHYRGRARGSDRAVQEAEVADLLRDSDLFAMSIYPFMDLGTPRPVPDDFLDFAPSLGKPVAVSESGMTSQDVRLASLGLTLRGSPDEQRHWVDLLLRVAARDRYRFVVQFATTDYPALVARLPAATADLARIWSRTGLQDDAGVAKPALAAWDAWFARPFVPR